MARILLLSFLSFYLLFTYPIQQTISYTLTRSDDHPQFFQFRSVGVDDEYPQVNISLLNPLSFTFLSRSIDSIISKEERFNGSIGIRKNYVWKNACFVFSILSLVSVETIINKTFVFFSSFQQKTIIKKKHAILLIFMIVFCLSWPTIDRREWM